MRGKKGEKEIMSEITEQNQDRLIIVIPAYNEEENIENVVASHRGKNRRGQSTVCHQ